MATHGTGSTDSHTIVSLLPAVLTWNYERVCLKSKYSNYLENIEVGSFMKYVEFTL